MRIRPFLIGLASIFGGLAIPVFGALWIFSSAYRRARLDALLAEPALLTGVGWPVLGAFTLCLALTVGGGVVLLRSLRRA